MHRMRYFHSSLWSHTAPAARILGWIPQIGSPQTRGPFHCRSCSRNTLTQIEHKHHCSYSRGEFLKRQGVEAVKILYSKYSALRDFTIPTSTMAERHCNDLEVRRLNYTRMAGRKGTPFNMPNTSLHIYAHNSHLLPFHFLGISRDDDCSLASILLLFPESCEALALSGFTVLLSARAHSAGRSWMNECFMFNNPSTPLFSRAD